jgi:hypothetical protein
MQTRPSGRTRPRARIRCYRHDCASAFGGLPVWQWRPGQAHGAQQPREPTGNAMNQSVSMSCVRQHSSSGNVHGMLLACSSSLYCASRGRHDSPTRQNELRTSLASTQRSAKSLMFANGCRKKWAGVAAGPHRHCVKGEAPRASPLWPCQRPCSAAVLTYGSFFFVARLGRAAKEFLDLYYCAVHPPSTLMDVPRI